MDKEKTENAYKADFTKKKETANEPFSKITEEPSGESGFSKREKDSKSNIINTADDGKSMEIQGNYTDFMRVNTSQSLKDYQNKPKANTGKIKYKSDQMGNKAKSFLMEFENKTKTTNQQIQVKDQDRKIKRLIRTSYENGKKGGSYFEDSQEYSKRVIEYDGENQSQGEGWSEENSEEYQEDSEGSDFEIEEYEEDLSLIHI